MPLSEQVVVCDAGPLIHLDEVACLDLLADFSTVLVPEVVWQEVTRHRPIMLLCFSACPKRKWTHRQPSSTFMISLI